MLIACLECLTSDGRIMMLKIMGTDIATDTGRIERPIGIEQPAEIGFFDGRADLYLGKLSRVLDAIDRDSIDSAIGVIADAWLRGKQIITLGNGGSAMTALHMISDWNKSIFNASKRQFRGRSLIDNMALVMSYGNDVSFEDIFVEQLKGIIQPGDLVIALSGSGNSENVIRAISYANQNQATTLGLCGYDGGRLKSVAQHVVWIKANDMQLCEDAHAIFGHIVMQSLCNMSDKSLSLAGDPLCPPCKQ